MDSTLPAPRAPLGRGSPIQGWLQSIWVALFAFTGLLLVSSCTWTHQMEPITEVRDLLFPEDARLGELYLIESELHFTSDSGERRVGKAQGKVEVAIPRGWSLELRAAKTEVRLDGLQRLAAEDLQGISLWNCRFREEDLLQLGHLKGLQELTLIGAPVSGRYLSQLKTLPKLSRLDLTASGVTDQGLKEIGRLQQLRSLQLGKTAITDAALAEVGKLGALKELDLYATKVSDDGLEHLAALNDLEILVLGFTQTSDRGIEQLARLTHLRQLNLDSTGLTDQGLASLKSLTQLQRLSLHDVKISEEGLVHLARSVSPCSIENRAIDLSRLFPECFAP